MISLNSGSSVGSLTTNLPKIEESVKLSLLQNEFKKPTHLQFGYQKSLLGVTLHAGEQQVIQRILSYRATGLSFKKIAAQMTSMGVLTKSGKIKWHPWMIKRILDYQEVVLSKN